MTKGVCLSLQLVLRAKGKDITCLVVRKYGKLIGVVEAKMVF